MKATAAKAISKLEAVKNAEAKLLLPTYDRHPVLFTRGRGVYLYDDAGNRYLDFLSGIGVNALGHGHPAIRKALAAQAAKVLHISNLFYHEYQSAVAERLTRLAGMDRVFFCNSGAESWEGALKLARAYAQLNAKKGKPAWRILALEHSFHGRTMGALSTTSTEKYRAPFEPLLPGVRFVRFNDVEDLERKFDDTVCAVAVEPLQGEGGINSLSPQFMAAARALTKKSGALLLCDEIQCGLGRTGLPFAFQRYRAKPDIVTVAKPLASGLPLGAILTTEAVSRAIHPGLHGTTFGGGPMSCAVALAFLEILENPSTLAHVNAIGDYFKRRLVELAARHNCVRDVRGAGLMLGMELNSAEQAKAAVKGLLERNIIANRTHETVLRFLPPYIITQKHVDTVIAALDELLAENSQDPGAPSLDRSKAGQRSQS
jgi:acetylornithine aminotransferase/acetylornithine/N-succinyldiaminopimelate aminotransferase